MKKQRRNGFTLIELLAVIIILGIVALIATPIILNVVENAQKKAFERSAQGYYDAARYVYNDMMLNEEEQETKFTFENGVQKSDNPKYTLTVQGEVPKKGLVYLSKDGDILVSIANDKWCATTNGSGTVELTDDPNACGYAPLECFTFSNFTLNNTIKNYITSQDLGFEGMDETLLQVESFDKENPLCKGIVIIPNEHEGNKVEGIKMNVFLNNTNITGVVFPKEMKIINNTAFKNASNLKQVVMNDELRYIGGGAFWLTNLGEVTIPSKVVYAGGQSFNISSLKKVTLLNTMRIPTRFSSMFPSKTIEEVVIGPNVQVIPSNMFTGHRITSLNIPDTVTSIGASAFANNQINNLTIGTALNGATATSFTGNPLTTLTIREGATAIKDNMFKDHQITNLALPSTLKTIGISSFDTNELTRVDIPNGVTSIGACAFCNNHLTDYTLPNTLVTLDKTVFNNNNLTGDKAFIYERNTNGSEDSSHIVAYVGPNGVNIIIPEGVKTIDASVFKDKELTGVTLPSTLIEINEELFMNNQLTSVTIPSSVTSIGENSFRHNQLTSLTLSNGLTVIGAGAFQYNNLTSIEIPNSVTIIDNYAFYANEITNLTLPNSLTSIGKGAFNVNQLPDDKAFIYARNSDGTIDKTTIVSYGGAKKDNIVIPNTVTSLGENSFYANQITSITIPDSVTSIGIQALYSNKITSIVIPSHLTRISMSSFAGNQLTSIVIPNAVSTIERGAFAGNKFPNAEAITILGDNPNRFDSEWTNIGFPAK